MSCIKTTGARNGAGVQRQGIAIGSCWCMRWLGLADVRRAGSRAKAGIGITGADHIVVWRRQE